MTSNGNIDWNDVFNGMILFAIVAGMARMTGKLLGESKPGKLLPQTAVTVVCPICGKTIEVPQYNCVTRSDMLKRHIDTAHGLKAQTALLPYTSDSKPASRIADKWRRAMKRNSALAFIDIEELRKTYGYDVDGCREALLDYRDIVREDYDDSDVYREAKDEAWQVFLDALEDLVAEEENSGSTLLPQAMIDEGEPIPYGYRYLAGWLSGPMSEYALLTLPSVVPEERKIDVVMKQLKDGVDGIQDSYQFRLFLNTMARFHDYSIGNTILIMLQRPDAGHVAGFHTWRQMERWVKAGEKGIAILAPVMPPRPTCSRCGGKLPKGSRYCPKCGADAPNADMEDAPRFFKVVYVFEYSACP